MPLEIFETLKTNDDVLRFFRLYFPDSIDLIGKEHLLECFFASKPSSLVTVKVSNFYFINRAKLFNYQFIYSYFSVTRIMEVNVFY